MKNCVRILFCIALLTLTISCLGQNKIKAGSICTVEDGNGKFGIVKVLVLEDSIVHVKIYKNTLDKRASKIDLKKLTTGSMYDKDGFGVEHTPLDKSTFYAWKPIEVAFQNVIKDELEGYNIWKESKD